MEANLEELKMQVANLIARVSMAEAQIAEMDDDMPEQPSASIAEESGSAYEPEYASYFKLYDASSAGTCRIGVKDGSTVNPASEHCGNVWANGQIRVVDNYLSDGLSTGYVWVWLVTTVGSDGLKCYVCTTDGTDPEDGGYANQYQLLGRASIEDDGNGGYYISSINQDYLKGGEHFVVLFWHCDLPEEDF